jgi:ketosteroid isomerase-like protein
MEKVTPRWQGALMSNEDIEHEGVEHEGVERETDEQQILALHEAGDKALMSADLAVLAQIFADDYVQYNESGKAFTKQDVLNNFRTGAIRYPSIVSTGRKIRVFGDTAVVHGSESDEVEAGGKKFSVRYVYLDVLRKTNGEWKLVASQLARPMEG